MKTTTPNSSNNPYQAYLLKIWLEPDREMSKSTWRFSLEDAYSGTRQGFTDLDSLLVYLQNLTGNRRGSAG